MKIEDLQKLIVDATKGARMVELMVYRNMKNSVQVWEKSNSDQIMNSDVWLTLVRKKNKQHLESIEAYESAKRQDLVLIERAQMTVLDQWLPRTLNENEVEHIIDALMISLEDPSIKNIMSELKELSKTNSIDMKHASGYAKQKN